MEPRIMRPGKTAKDRRTGAWANHKENQETRRAWNQSYAANSKIGGHKILPYPVVAH